jgi:hypothetical protein
MDNKTCKGGVYKHLNTYPTVVKNPTRYTGGKNAPVTPVKNPTRYTGGKNPNLVTVKKSF